jgi:hypothetical protein
MTIDDGRWLDEIDGAVGCAAGNFSRTKILSPSCSTRQQAIESSAGARSASPVRRLKHA